MISARIRLMAFDLIALSDKQRFFDMYATFVMKDDPQFPEAKSIFETEFEYFKNKMVPVLDKWLRLYLGYTLEGLAESLWEFENPMTEKKEEYFIDNMNIVVELTNIKGLHEEIQKALTGDDKAREKVFNIFQTQIEGKEHKLIDKLSWGEVISFSKEYLVPPYSSKNWPFIVHAIDNLNDFVWFDHLLDIYHEAGNLRDDFVLLAPELKSWLNKEVLDIKTNSKSLKELRLHTSPEVRKMIYQYSQLHVAEVLL